jgi:hypothetical protein
MTKAENVSNHAMPVIAVTKINPFYNDYKV